MMKILIDNEEVVSNSNLQIKEEMLSTSSTILKNCYPATWEEDKDYTSRYYFPKDYSKCKIIDETYYPEIIGTRVSGTSLNITYDSNLNWDFEQVQGNTQQTGTPTPDSPVPIQTVTGRQLVSINHTFPTGYTPVDYIESSGTQYINTGYKVKPTTKIDLDFAYIGTSTSNTWIPIFGERGATSQTYFALFVNETNLKLSPNYGGFDPGNTSQTTIEKNKKYNIKNDGGNFYLDDELKSDISTYLTLSESDKNILLFDLILTNGYTINRGCKAKIYQCKFYEGNTLIRNMIPCYRNSDNEVGMYDLVNNVFYTNQGTGSFTYGSIVGEQQYEINLGKNLFDKNNTNKLDGYINSAGTITSEAKNKTIYIPCKSSTTYTVSKIASTRFGIASYSTTPQIGSTTSNFTRDNSATHLTLTTGSSDTYLAVWYYNHYNDTLTEQQILDSIQVEEGSQASSFSPYFTPIELNKIGTYQDSIKRSTGKNLFDKLTAIVGKNWNGDNMVYSIASDYIEVEEGKTYVISTANMSSYSSTTVVKFDSNKNVVLPAITTNPFTVPEGIKYIKLSIRSATSHTWTQSELDNAQYQLEQNSQATDFEPYLPKGTWYIEKKVGGVVLDGSESWVKRTDVSTTNTSCFRLGYDNVINLQSVLSNNFICMNNIRDEEHFRYSSNVNGYAFQLFINKSRLGSDTATGLQTWLSAHNTIVKYILATPTYTEITNEELLGQLNAIENASLFDGTNNIIVSSANLPGAIQIYYNYQHEHTTQDLLFCGCVKNTGNISLNPREPHYVDLQVLDFKDLLSTGETLDFVINNKTITQAITQVVDAISDYGFVVGDVKVLSPNDIINAYSTLNKTPYDVFQYIADITQSRWTTRVIDENTIAIDFYDPSLMPEAQPIEDTEEYYCNNEIDSITFNYSTNDYRNKQIMTSDEVYSNITQTETIIADGYRDSFICQNKIGVITNIKVNGIDSTFTTKTEYEMGISADFIYTPGEMTFTANQIYPAGTIISIEYYAIVKGREIVLNTSEITRVEDQIGRKGIISRYENRNDTTSSQELIKIGQSYIKYKGNAEITLKVVSENNLFNVGEIVNYSAPLEELSIDYMVKSKTIDMYINAGKIFYIYELSNNFNSENAINYFDNQRAKNQGNLGQGETITRNIDIEATALIQFYDYTIEEVQVGTNTTLDFTLDSVL
ncbi:MAG: hypothetical protein VZS44_09980 [Bacilli bacterium]|nr:hypothetical protein [Bacilli bacterium]